MSSTRSSAGLVSISRVIPQLRKEILFIIANGFVKKASIRDDN
jgi:hypothetical protein